MKVAARVLENLNIDLTKVRTQVIRMLGETAEVGTGTNTTKGNLKTATLDEFGTNLTKLASESKLDPVVGRHSEICLLYTSPSPRDISGSRMPSSA